MQNLHDEYVTSIESHATTTAHSTAAEEPQNVWAHDCPLPVSKRTALPHPAPLFTAAVGSLSTRNRLNTFIRYTTSAELWKVGLRGAYIKSASKSLVGDIQRRSHCMAPPSLCAVAQSEGDCPLLPHCAPLSSLECGNEKILFSCQIAQVNGELAPLQLVQTFHEYKKLIYLFVISFFAPWWRVRLWRQWPHVVTDFNQSVPNNFSPSWAQYKYFTTRSFLEKTQKVFKLPLVQHDRNSFLCVPITLRLVSWWDLWNVLSFRSSTKQNQSGWNWGRSFQWR